MKYFAIFTVFLLVLALLGVGCLYMTANMVVEGVGVIAVEASAMQEEFEALKTQLHNGAVSGTLYTSESALGDATQYQFYTYTVRLRNNCFLLADMVEVQVTPMPGDVLQVGQSGEVQIAARITGDVTATILTSIDMHAVRELNITYYMWGIPFTVQTVYRTR